jgi:hypothetical protein
MKLQIEEAYPGEFDEEPEVLERKAVDAAHEAIYQLIKGYQSHTDMPKVGDTVKNTNPGCTHYKSEGVVTAVKDLPGGKGKTISYRCTNDGDKWKAGDVLQKTPDQLSPMKKHLEGLEKGGVRRGGQVDALDTVADMMSKLYSQRLQLLKRDLAKAVKGRE